jgi:hypothetical protein
MRMAARQFVNCNRIVSKVFDVFDWIKFEDRKICTKTRLNFVIRRLGFPTQPKKWSMT